MAIVEETARSLSIFDGLASFSRAQVEFLNSYQRIFGGRNDCQDWISEALGELLESFQGARVHISQLNQVEPEQEQSYLFEKREILIGRAEDNDIVLTRSAVSRRHARMFGRGSAYFVEDLGSGAGTHLNGRALAVAEPQPLTNGDELLVFPYKLQVRIEEVWAPEGELQISKSLVKVTTDAHFRDEVSSSFCLFRVQLHPDYGDALLAVNRDFLRDVVSGMLHETVNELSVTDLGLFEFVLAHMIERLNRRVKIPLQLSIQTAPSAFTSVSGLSGVVTVKTPRTSATLKIFVPDASLARIRQFATVSSAQILRSSINVRIPFRVGHVDVPCSDLAGLEPGDIVLYRAAPELVLPVAAVEAKDAERGWRATEIARSPYRFELQNYFERSLFMESVRIPETGDSPETNLKVQSQDARSLDISKVNVAQPDSLNPDLTGIPIRVYVVLSQVELSLRDLSTLTEGTIIELEYSKGDSVQLVASGTLLGTGELVEIEDKLGVRITKWSEN
jgi:type III secretion system YscQ/HrcQ family protein